MSSAAAPIDTVEIAKANFPAIEKGIPGEKLITSAERDQEEEKQAIDAISDSTGHDVLLGPNGEQYPTKEELETLPRVVGKVGLVIYSVAFIELCERFAYYGTTAVCKWSLSSYVISIL
jgi:proton-dependent oligopeptide transporter, POT family